MKKYVIQGSSVLAGVAAGALLMTGAVPVVAQMAPTPTPTPVPSPSPSPSPTPTPTPPLSAPGAPAATTAAPATTDCPAGATNCSLIEQDGTNLEANISQTGTGNVSDVDQINGSVGTSGDVEVDVVQSGNDNSSYVLQSSSGIAGFETIADVDQVGDGASSVIRQENTRNHRAVVTQDGASTSFISQSAGQSATAEVRQEGDDNDSVIFQQGAILFGVGNGNPANADGVTQIGSLNNSEIYQGDFSGGALTEGQRARVDQEGDRNDSFISQTLVRTLNGSQNVNVDQEGDDNISSVIQTGFRAGQDVNVTQSGSDNLSRIVQNDEDNTGGGNQVTVDQTNDGNDAFVDQSSGQGLVEITQISTNTSGVVTGISRNRGLLSGSDTVRANFAFVQQSFGGVTEATIFQDGFGNRALVDQANIALDPSDANINQYGLFNNSESLHDGDGTVNVDQGTMGDDASRNSSLVDQSGFGNLADVDQTGDDNLSDIIQNAGSADNQALVTQAGIFDVSMIEQSGSNNIATVNQGTP